MASAVERRNAHLRAVAVIVGGLCVLAIAATGLPTVVTGASLLVCAVAIGVLEHRYRNNHSISLSVGALGVTVLLWAIIADASDPGYGFAGILFILFGLLSIFGLSDVRQTFREFGEQLGHKLQ